MQTARADVGTASAGTNRDEEAVTRRAATNLRRHAWRAVRRVGALLTVDAACFLIARTVTKQFAEGSVATADLMLASWSAAPRNDLALAIALLIGTTVSGTYGAGDLHRHPGRLFAAAAIGGVLPLWPFLWSLPLVDAVQAATIACAPLFFGLVALRTAFGIAGEQWSHRSRDNRLARTVLIGDVSDCLAHLAGDPLTRRGGFDVLGFIDIADRPSGSALGGVTDVEHLLYEHDVDTVVFCGFPTTDTTTRVLRAAAVAECTVLAMAPQLEHPAVKPCLITQGGRPLLQMRPVALRAEQLVLKRMMDIVAAAVGLVVLAPVFVVIALLVWLDSPGPVLFVQRRLGRLGRPIRCYKFRSMDADAEAQLLADPILLRRYVEHNYKLPAAMDRRITRLGRVLRRTSLDELPQLWNVLSGDMSLVGPRPIVPDEIHHYNGEGPLLLSLKPGITGAWQVNGRSSLPYPERAAVELEYVEGWSLWRDLTILVRTVPAVLRARGAD